MKTSKYAYARWAVTLLQSHNGLLESMRQTPSALNGVEVNRLEGMICLSNTCMIRWMKIYAK